MANRIKEFSERELSIYNGENHERMYIAYKGIVYDVTDCPKWRTGLHEMMHYPGQDLSKELDHDAPHAGGVFSHPCITVAGRLNKS